MFNVTLLILLGVCAVSVNGFCSRPYDFFVWEPQSIVERSMDADIIIFAEIMDSPCRKPAPLTTIPPPTTAAILEKIGLNSTGNSTGNETEYATPEPTPIPTTTSVPTTVPMNVSSSIEPRHNCSTDPYNVSVKIHCVIKGGALPEYINIDGIGLSEDMCISYDWNETEHDYHAYHGQNYTFFLKREDMCISYDWNETEHDYHAYHGQNYTFFLKRRHNFMPQEDSFTLHPINVQPAMVEVPSATTDLLPVFRIAGGHAHAAMGVWVNKTDPICKPYSGANGLTVLPVAMAMVMSMVAMATNF
ncbi:hypothetical protein QZH41_018985 [Actinostola sp. cb2023]|nr:hypothetical protein QZH41_018985 [Actinostola sp. cb2023]